VSDLKRVIQTLLFILLLGLPLSASAADSFKIEIDDSGTAGDYLGVTINAFTGPSPDGGYTGTVNFTVSPHPGTVSPTVSGNFSGGEWKGAVKFFAADDEVVLTCTDGGATGNTITTVYAGLGTQLLILVPGETHTPGFAPGVTPTEPVHLIEGVNHPVTVYVVDDLWNWNKSFMTSIDSSGVGAEITPASFNTSDGRAFFTLRLTMTGLITTSFTSPDPFSNTKQVYSDSASVAWLHLKVPSQITAGAPFALTATVSSSPGDPDQVLTTNSDTFKINRYLSGTSDPASGNWGGPSENLTMVNGQLSRDDFTYDRAESIYLCGEKTSGGSISLIGVSTTPIEVLPNVPAAIQTTLDPAEVQAQHTTHITAHILDQHGNPTRSTLHSFIVKFDQVSGSGFLSVSQTATDLNGNAYCNFTGGVVNEEARIRVRAEHSVTQHLYAETIMPVKVSVAPPQPGAILNYPNPFNPAQDQKTSINYYLNSRGNVEIRIYDAFGRLVLSRDISETAADSVSQNATAAGGAYWEWDGRNGEGRIVANGIYLVNITARGSSGAQKLKRRVGVLK
jgi:hypothetical protein